MSNINKKIGLNAKDKKMILKSTNAICKNLILIHNRYLHL
jgi:hypothetical protein